jgi:soluble lytic murein transglycosylase-like protein
VLQQATRDRHEQTTDRDSLLWLSCISEHLVKRIPNPYYRVTLLKSVRAEARKSALDPQQILAVIDIESGFNHHALSHAGA